MVRFGLALALVLAISTTAMAGNGSRKIRSFAPGGGVNGNELNVDGVGVISFSPGKSANTLHVVLTDLQPDTDYDFQAFADTDMLVPIPGFAGSFTTNSAGNGQGKVDVPVTLDLSDIVAEVIIFRGTDAVAETTEISN